MPNRSAPASDPTFDSDNETIADKQVRLDSIALLSCRACSDNPVAAC